MITEKLAKRSFHFPVAHSCDSSSNSFHSHLATMRTKSRRGACVVVCTCVRVCVRVFTSALSTHSENP